METTEAKKEETKEVDSKGVPIENRVKEVERKLTEKHEREMAAMRQELEALKTPKTETKTADAVQAKLMEFVKDPDAYIHAKAQELNFRDRMSQVKPWVESQKGFVVEDKDRLIAISNEYQLAHPDPLDRVKAAWSILQKEKAAAAAESHNEESRRETAIKKSSADGSGRSTSKENGPTRADVLKKLAEAQSKGNDMDSVKYIDMLEDLRE